MCAAVVFRGEFQSTLPGWGATISEPGLYRLVIFQSTLPGWGATWLLLWRLGGGRHFNPRSPDGERRGWETVPNRRSGFQSTLPGWGATAAAGVRVRGLWYFNPRSPDGERPLSRCAQYNRVIISIHAPRMGSDLFERVWRGSHLIFQSTLPGWGATAAKREAKDAQEFQSTLPGWGATGAVFLMRGLVVISIHAPRMGSDSVTVYVP